MDLSTIAFSAGLAGVDDDHEAVLAAVMELHASLLERGLVGQHDSADRRGTKGWEQYLTIVVGGGGALGSVVAMFRAWLDRDRRRFLVLRKKIDGQTVGEIEIVGDTVSDETIRAALERIVDLD